MKLITNSIFEILGADPMTTSEITDKLYPDMDGGSRHDKRTYVYRTLDQLSKDGKIEKILVESPFGYKIATWAVKI